MIVALANLFSLIATATLSAVIMALAWAHFGRSRVALCWSLSAAATALQWSIGLLGGLLWPPSNWPVFMSGIFLVLAGGLLASGAREAGGRRSYARILCTACGAMIVWQALALFVLADRAVWALTANLFVALTMAIAAWSVLPDGRRARSPEIAVALVFGCLAAFTALLVTLSPGIGATGTGATAELYRVLVVIALPGLYAAMGSAGIFMIAAQLAAKVELLATTDPLTGTLNRRGLEQAAETLIAQARKASRPIAVIVADLDRLKSINDTHGHHAGDEALLALARVMRETLGAGATVARLSGDEFCVLLPGDVTEATAAVARMRAALANILMPFDSKVSASFGQAMLTPGDQALSDVLHRADRRLYEDKRGDRRGAAVVLAASAA